MQLCAWPHDGRCSSHPHSALLPRSRPVHPHYRILLKHKPLTSIMQLEIWRRSGTRRAIPSKTCRSPPFAQNQNCFQRRKGPAIQHYQADFLLKNTKLTFSLCSCLASTLLEWNLQSAGNRNSLIPFLFVSPWASICSAAFFGAVRRMPLTALAFSSFFNSLENCKRFTFDPNHLCAAPLPEFTTVI
jgi:hypothetical protein